MNANVAQTILSQLGGGRFIAMAGAKDLLADVNGLSCKIGRNARKVNYLTVVLDGDDTYTVTSYHYGKYELNQLDAASNVYADQLQREVERQTGLYLSL